MSLERVLMAALVGRVLAGEVDTLGPVVIDMPTR